MKKRLIPIIAFVGVAAVALITSEPAQAAEAGRYIAAGRFGRY